MSIIIYGIEESHTIVTHGLRGSVHFSLLIDVEMSGKREKRQYGAIRATVAEARDAAYSAAFQFISYPLRREGASVEQHS